MAIKDKDIVICSRCLSKNIKLDKGILPGGIALLEFHLNYICNNCGNRRGMLLITNKEYQN